MPSKPPTGVTETRKIVVRRTTTSSKGKQGQVPVELQPYKPLSDKQRMWVAGTRSRKNGTTVEDELASLNQQIAEDLKHVVEIEGRQMIPKTRVPKQRIERGVNKKRKGKRQISEERKAELQKKREVAEQALELRKAAVPYQKIADTLGYASAGSAKNAVDRLMSKMEFEAAKDVVLIDLQRLDEYQMRCTERLRNTGDLGQIDRLMRIMEMRYRIIGVNDETAHELQQHFGLNVVNKGVMVIQGTEADFVSTMMAAVGIDPESAEGQAYVNSATNRAITAAPIARDEHVAHDTGKRLKDEDIVDAEIIEALDTQYDL